MAEIYTRQAAGCKRKREKRAVCEGGTEKKYKIIR